MSQEKRNYHETIHDGAIGIKDTIQDSAKGMKSWLVGHCLQAKNRVIDLFDATPDNFLMAVVFSKGVLRLIRAKNERTQLCLQIELAEEKSQPLHSEKSPLGTKFCVQPWNLSETFWQTLSPNQARPEKPGPNYNSAWSISVIFYIVWFPLVHQNWSHLTFVWSGMPLV